MADPIRLSTLEALRRTVREKERELSDLDLMLADYHTERSRLIDTLRQLRAAPRRRGVVLIGPHL